MAIVVTGASGQLGAATVRSLLERGVAAQEIVATGRDTSKLADLAGLGVRTAKLDYDAVEDGVLGEGDTLVFVSGSEVGQRARQHANVVEAAKAAGVARIVYTSVVNVESPTLVVAPEHAVTENLIRESGVPFTFARNGWYTENYVPAFEQARATGEVIGSVGQGRVSSASRDDFAEALAVLATGEGHEGRAYDLVAPTAWTHDELAAVFADVLGREVVYRDLTPDEHRAALASAGLDDGTIGFLVAADANIAAGELGVTGDDLGGLLGRAPRTLRETVGTWA